MKSPKKTNKIDNYSRNVSGIPTKMQSEIMNVVEDLCDEFKSQNKTVLYPSIKEIHDRRCIDGSITNTSTMLSVLSNKGWLNKIPIKHSITLYHSTDKWTKVKNNLNIMVKMAIPKIINRMKFRGGRCGKCGRSFNRLTPFKGEKLCRNCLCPNQKKSYEDISLVKSNMINILE